MKIPKQRVPNKEAHAGPKLELWENSGFFRGPFSLVRPVGGRFPREVWIRVGPRKATDFSACQITRDPITFWEW